MAATLGDLASMEYTRGNPGDADNRGATLVEKHNERMQQEREETSLEKVGAREPFIKTSAPGRAASQAGSGSQRGRHAPGPGGAGAAVARRRHRCGGPPRTANRARPPPRTPSGPS